MRKSLLWLLLVAAVMAFMGLGCGGDDSESDNTPDGDDTETPADGDDTETPVDGDETETPVDGDEIENPVDGDEIENPVDGDEIENPVDGDETDNPVDGDPDPDGDVTEGESEIDPWTPYCETPETSPYGACDTRSYCQDTDYACNLPEECLWGLCLSLNDGWTTFCSQPCDEAHECPSGMECLDATDVEDIGSWICVPVEEEPLLPGDGTKEAYEVCNVNEDCKGGALCLGYGGVKFCSPICETTTREGDDTLCGDCGSCFDATDIDGINTFICTPKGSNDFGEVCGYAFDCSTLFCYGRYCSQECDDETPCPTDYTCIDSGDGSFCVADTDLNKPYGYECLGDWECASGMCEDVLGTMLCLEPCGAEDSCPEGASCVAMGDAVTDTILDVYGPDGTTVLGHNDDYQGVNSMLELTFAAEGIYYIKVSGFSASTEGPYVLKVEDVTPAKARASATVETEPNNTAETANGIEIGASLAAVITAADQDWFSISVTAGKVLHITTNPAPIKTCLLDGVIDTADYGDFCEETYQCKGDLECASGICTLACETDTDCPDGICYDFGEYNGQWCVPASFIDTQAYGDDCQYDFQCAGDNVCFNAYCTLACDTNSDCPNGVCYGFTVFTEEDEEVTQYMCVPEEMTHTLDNGETCDYAFECPAEGVCYEDPLAEAPYCSLACDEGACPEGLGCFNGMCVAPIGPRYLYWGCRLNEDCEAGTTCQNGLCTLTCTDDASCEGNAAVDPGESVLCQSCYEDADCGEDGANFCLSGICGLDCTGDASICPTGTRCVEIPYYIWTFYQCFPITGSCEGGAVCGSESNTCVVPTAGPGEGCVEDDNCLTGICEEGMCTSECSISDDCECEHLTCSEDSVCVTESNEVEPNDTLATAQMLQSLPFAGVASFAPSATQADVDMFKIHVEAGQFVMITTDAFCLTEADTYLRLLDSAGNVLAENDDKDASYGDYFSVIQLQIETEGDYTIEVTQSPWVAGLLRAHYLLNVNVADAPANETCGTAIELFPVKAMYFTGDTTFATDDYHGATCTGYSVSGPDLAYVGTIPAGEALRVELSSATDLAVYAVTDCADSANTCLAGADAAGSDGTEELVVPNATGSDLTVYLIVDSYSAYYVGAFELTAGLIELTPPENDTGDNAEFISATGTYEGRTLGAANDYDPGVSGCYGAALPGPDVVYSFILDSYDLLNVLLPGYQLYLVTDYDDLTSCVASGNGELEFFYDPTVKVAPNFYLIVDSTSETGGGFFEMDVAITPVVCEENVSIEAMPYNGQHTLAGNDFDLGSKCSDYDTTGADLAFSVDLDIGETIRVKAIPVTDADLSIHITRNCVGVAACKDYWYGTSFENLDFTADQAGTYLIIVDSDGTATYESLDFALSVVSGPVDECGGVTEYGCCSSDTSNSICEGGCVHSFTCSGDYVCGWDDYYEQYVCTGSNASAPDNDPPRECPAI